MHRLSNVNLCDIMQKMTGWFFFTVKPKTKINNHIPFKWKLFACVPVRWCFSSFPFHQTMAKKFSLMSSAFLIKKQNKTNNNDLLHMWAYFEVLNNGFGQTTLSLGAHRCRKVLTEQLYECKDKNSKNRFSVAQQWHEFKSHSKWDRAHSLAVILKNIALAANGQWEEKT